MNGRRNSKQSRGVVQIALLYYNENMGATIQVRLDEKSEAALKRLVRAKGCTPSQAVRESILKDDEQLRAKPRPRLIGIGCVSFGPGDVGTNQKRMEGFGKKARQGKERQGRWDW